MVDRDPASRAFEPPASPASDSSAAQAQAQVKRRSARHLERPSGLMGAQQIPTSPPWYRRRAFLAVGLCLVVLVASVSIVAINRAAGEDQASTRTQQPSKPVTHPGQQLPPSVVPQEEGPPRENNVEEPAGVSSPSTSPQQAGDSMRTPMNSGSPSSAPISTSPSRSGRLTPGVLPRPGQGALFGMWISGGADIRTLERQTGLTFGAARRYKDFNAAQLWPNDEDQALAAGGRVLHMSWETMSYNGAHDAALQPAPGVSAHDAHSNQSRKLWTYKQILNGSLDGYIDAVAIRVKKSNATFIIDFNHEADDLPEAGGSNTQRKATGTLSEYAASYRYLVDRFEAAAATNVVWAITWSGWMAKYPDKHWVYQQMWPGKGYVDLILWDPYNSTSSNWRSFTQIVTPMYEALRGGMLDKVDPTAKNLPYGLGEFGSTPDGRRPQWLRDLPAQLRQFPQITYLAYFSSGAWGTLHNDQNSIAALGHMLSNDYFVRSSAAGG